MERRRCGGGGGGGGGRAGRVDAVGYERGICTEDRKAARYDRCRPTTPTASTASLIASKIHGRRATVRSL